MKAPLIIAMNGTVSLIIHSLGRPLRYNDRVIAQFCEIESIGQIDRIFYGRTIFN